ncbi:MAG: DUF642 domain-containing protein [Limisphaerales bacterium]
MKEAQYQLSFTRGASTGGASAKLNATQVAAGMFGVLIFFTALVPAAWGAPFTNGSFEVPQLAPNSIYYFQNGDTNLVGWTVGGVPSVLGLFNGYPPNTDSIGPVDGSQFLVFNGGQGPVGQTVSQTFSTIPGESYAVRFNVGKMSAAPGLMQITAVVAASDGSERGVVAGSQSAVGWGPATTLTFTATTSTSTLTFADTSSTTTGAGVALDNISVELLNPPALSLSGDLSFGNVAVGSYVFRSLVISNTGNVSLTVSNINCPADFTVDWRAGTIPVGGTQGVFVIFQPAAIQSYTGALSVTSDAVTGSDQISVSGQGVRKGTAPKTRWVQSINFILMAWAQGNSQATGIGNKNILSALSGASFGGSEPLPTFTTGSQLLVQQNLGTLDTRMVVRVGSDNNTIDYDVTGLLAPPSTAAYEPQISYVRNGASNYHVITTFALDIPNVMSFGVSGLTAASYASVTRTNSMSKGLSGTVAGSGVINGQTNLIGGTVSLSGGRLE